VDRSLTFWLEESRSMGFTDLPTVVSASSTSVGSEAQPGFAESIGGCSGCVLCQGQQRFAYGQGPESVDLMMIGAAPSSEEIHTSHLFEGPSAELLTAMIEKGMKRSRSSVFVAHILPVGSREGASSGASCLPFLSAQIEAINPKVLVLLGATVLKVFRADLQGINSSLRGQWTEVLGRPTLPTFHPSFLLRQPQAKREAWNDLKRVMERLGWS
jgi:uracil-DNA glycosylase